MLPEATISAANQSDMISQHSSSDISPWNLRTEETSLLTKAISYTAFTSHQKSLLPVLGGLSTMSSPERAIIYFPILTLLREHFHIPAEVINLTIILYIIFQAIYPTVFGAACDSFGHRSVYLIALMFHAAATLALR
jgi:MFS family permease